MLTLRQIEVFRAVMRAQTLVGAASELKIAQPTVTKTIRRIEDLLRIQLFDRAGGRLIPSAEARRILEEVDRAFEQLETAIERAARIARSDEGLFRFGASPSLGRVLVPRAIGTLIRRRPGVSVHFDVLSVAQVLDYLISGPGEGAVTLFPITHGIVQSTLVGTGRMVALVPPGCLPSGAERLRPEDLDGATLVVFEPQSVHGQMLSRFLNTGSVMPRKTHVVRFAETAIGLADTACALPIFVQSTLVGAGRMVALVPSGSLPSGAERLRPEDLTGATLVVFEPQSVHGQMLSRFLNTGSVTPRKTHVVRFAETAIGLADTACALPIFVQSTLVGAGRMVALVPSGSLPSGAERLRPEDLTGATLVVFEPQSVHGQMLSRFLNTGSVTPRKTHVVRFAETAIGL